MSKKPIPKNEIVVEQHETAHDWATFYYDSNEAREWLINQIPTLYSYWHHRENHFFVQASPLLHIQETFDYLVNGYNE